MCGISPLRWLPAGIVSIGGAITAGGLNSNTAYPASPNNLLALIPARGGIVQVRMKAGTTGLNSGQYTGIECDAVDGASGISGNSSNANFEFGYAYAGASGVQGFGMSINNTANQGKTPSVITTGDDGVGSGDATNWHVYVLEWTGSAWYYYVDGISQSVITHTGSAVPSVGFSCSITNFMATSQESSFHSTWNTSSPGGPFDMYVSDFQIYKKP